MNSIKQFFSYMNDINFEYVVLRNFDRLPYDVMLGEHSDLDLLVYDFDHWKELFPEAKAEYEYPRVRFKLPIDDSYIYCDVRHLGDDYYPLELEETILKTREWNARGFFTPDPMRHTLALAYHAVHHKNYISKDYRRFLGDAETQDLLQALKASSVGWVPPKDKTVGSFNGYWRGATSIVRKENGCIVKEQVSYKGFNLIQNENRILGNIDSLHFPKVYGCKESEIVIEDCGVPILESLPENYEAQLDQILKDLKDHKVIHRDIKLDNLMVKDGIVKLIDFGWAKFEEDPDSEVPSCLGYPNKPSYGFDDSYSMRAVKKQIEFSLEERQQCVS